MAEEYYSLAEAERRYQRAKEEMRKVHEQMLEAVKLVVDTKIPLAKAWIRENYPQYIDDILFAPITKSAPHIYETGFRMSSTIDVPTLERIGKELKIYLDGIAWNIGRTNIKISPWYML